MAAPPVRFRVRKGAKLLFECEVARREALPAELQQYLVRADETALLRDAEIAITKRLNIVEVDRMIACCRQHPPQALVSPVPCDAASPSDGRTAFEDLAVYLKQRERAGVGSIGPGLLVMLIPLQDRNDVLRCQIVNTTTTVGEIGATVFAPAVDQTPADGHALVPPPATPEVSSNGSSATVTSPSTAPEGEPNVETTITSCRFVENSAASATDDAATAEPDPFAKLRHEHSAFHAFYHHVLLEWSTKPSDIDSAQELAKERS